MMKKIYNNNKEIGGQENKTPSWNVSIIRILSEMI